LLWDQVSSLAPDLPAIASIAARATFPNHREVIEQISSCRDDRISHIVDVFGVARIAGSLSATFAQNVPKAALQRPAKGTSIGSPGAPAS